MLCVCCVRWREKGSEPHKTVSTAHTIRTRILTYIHMQSVLSLFTVAFVFLDSTTHKHVHNLSTSTTTAYNNNNNTNNHNIPVLYYCTIVCVGVCVLL